MTHSQPTDYRGHALGDHCESCGSTDLEDLTTGDQGYTACCNEPVVYECTDPNLRPYVLTYGW